MGYRLTVGHQTLNLLVGVRIPVPQSSSHSKRLNCLCKSGSFIKKGVIMKRKTTDTPKIPSEKAPSKRAETKGILAFATPNSSTKAPSPSATRNSNLSVAPAPVPLTPFQELIEEWLTYCKAGGLSPKTIITYRDFVSKFYWWWAEYAHKGREKAKNLTRPM